MKWKTPRPGIRRWKKRFAWWPTTTTVGGYTIWLEFYWAFEVYSIYDFTSVTYKWHSLRRLTIEEYKKENK